MPAIGLADDALDPELIARPRRWNLRFIGRIMLEFGAVSACADSSFLTGKILDVFHKAFHLDDFHRPGGRGIPLIRPS